jgi:hypothetical protein
MLPPPLGLQSVGLGISSVIQTCCKEIGHSHLSEGVGKWSAVWANGNSRQENYILQVLCMFSFTGRKMELWRKTALFTSPLHVHRGPSQILVLCPWKKSVFSQFHFPPLMITILGSWKGSFSYLLFLLAQAGYYWFLTASCGSECLPCTMPI